MTKLSKIKIDLVAVPFSGHLYPLLEIISPLLTNPEYEIRLFTGVQKIEIAERLGINVIPLFPDEPTKMENIANTNKQVKAFGMYHQLKQNLAIIPEIIEVLNTEFQENGTDIVIADFLSIPAGIVCEKLRIPWITTIPTPFAIESKTATPSYLGGWRPHESFLMKGRDMVGRQIVHNFKKFIVWLLRREINPYNFHLYNVKGEETIYSPYSILGLGMSEIEFRQDFPTQFKWAGPCCRSFEEDIVDLPTDKLLVLVTIGTHLLWGKKELEDLIVKLAQMHPSLNFCISLGEKQRQSTIINEQKNIFIYDYLPYNQVMPLVTYVIHHGGAGIFYNCLKYQVPALIIPHDYDQFDYAVRGEMADVALVAKRGNQKKIMKAFSILIHRKMWPSLIKLSQDFKNYKPSVILEEEIKRLVREGGEN